MQRVVSAEGGPDLIDLLAQGQWLHTQWRRDGTCVRGLPIGNLWQCCRLLTLDSEVSMLRGMPTEAQAVL